MLFRSGAHSRTGVTRRGGTCAGNGRTASHAYRSGLTGLQMDDPKLLDILEDNKLRIVGDYLAQESIQYNSDIPEGTDGLSRLAAYWGVIEGFSPAYDPKKLRGKLMVELARNRKTRPHVHLRRQPIDEKE